MNSCTATRSANLHVRERKFSVDKSAKMSYGATSEQSPLRQRFNVDLHSNEVPLEDYTTENQNSNNEGVHDQFDDDFAVGLTPLIPIWYDRQEVAVHWRKLVSMFFYYFTFQFEICNSEVTNLNLKTFLIDYTLIYFTSSLFSFSFLILLFFLGELFSEWLGVTLFVYMGTGSVIASAPFEGRLSSASVVCIALAFGFGITTYVFKINSIFNISFFLNYYFYCVQFNLLLSVVYFSFFH